MARSVDALEEMKTLDVDVPKKKGSNGAHHGGNGEISLAEEAEAQKCVLSKISETADTMEVLMSEVRSQMQEVDRKLRELDIRMAQADEVSDG